MGEEVTKHTFIYGSPMLFVINDDGVSKYGPETGEPHQHPGRMSCFDREGYPLVMNTSILPGLSADVSIDIA
jgi:hypothetical protein